MAQINKPSEYFNTKLYTGTGAEQSITGVGFQPDWVWTKSRTSAYNHNSYDSVRGANKTLYQDLTNAEYVGTQGVKSFDSDGFTVGTDVAVNQSSANLVAWNWLAGGTPSSNTDGDITSSVSANTTSGFSIVSYTGTGATATVGHGLSQTPEMVIVKLRSGSGTDWTVWGSVLGGTVGSEKMQLNNTGAKSTGLNSSWFNNTAPDSDVFTIGTQSDLNTSSSTYIGYCFHSVKGYSKFGQYTGNGSTDGTFVYTGMRPAFIIVKRTDTTNDWYIMDSTRSSYNPTANQLFADLSNAEVTDQEIDILSNGFKCRRVNDGTNASGGTYIYMAFAENPLVGTNNIPATAR